MKKLISTIMSLAVACTGLAATNAGAIARPFDLNSDTFAGYEELYYIDDSENSHSVFTKMVTIADTENTFRDYIHVTYYSTHLIITSESNTFDERITDILSSYGLACKVYAGEYRMNYSSRIDDNFPYTREIYEKIAKIASIKDFKISGSYAIASGHGRITFESPTYYWGISEKQIDSLAEYIKEKSLDFTLERGKSEGVNFEGEEVYECNIIPNYDIEFDEHLQIAADIANTFGIDIPIEYQSIARTFSGSGDIDVLNSIDGDANGDGEMNIADATAIVQAIGNKDKYGLTAQGEFNADLDGNGLTGADAVAIQKKLVEMGTI
ncbi:MAG: dockerin type I repeat-containing protein [Ruminococcus sp.]|nr:dockerin type I repeat-containing protein [Ruminococcus sp.]